MKKLALVLMLAVGLTACDNKETPAVDAKPTIKIGAIFPISGEMGDIGQGLKSAILMAKEDLSKKELKNHYEFVIEDDGFDVKRTILAFNKLSSVDDVDALISFSSQSGVVLSELSEKNKLVHFNVGASERKVAEGDYNFVHWTIPKYTSLALLEYYKDKGYKKVVVITPNNSGCIAILDAFKDNAKSYPELEVIEFNTQPNEIDYRLLLAKVKDINPDVVLTLSYANNAIAFIKQYKNSGIKTPLTNIETLSTLSSFEGLDGIKRSSIAQADDAFYERFNNKYKNVGNLGIGNTYDMVMLLVKSFETADKKEDALKEMQNIKEYDGVVGRLNQDETGLFNSQAIMTQIKNGKAVLLEE